MGNHWGSIHFRTRDRNAVIKAITPLAKVGRQFLVGPVIDGWVGVYPSGHGLVDAADIAKAVGEQAFQLLVHDSDVFCYRYFRKGKQVDEFMSVPGYFSPEDYAKDRKLTGHPELFSFLLDKPLPEIKRLLRHPEKFSVNLPDAMQQITDFAAALGIANVSTCYEYLCEADAAEHIKQRDKFTHVPSEGGSAETDVDESEADEPEEIPAVVTPPAPPKGADRLLAKWVGKKGQFHYLLPASDGFVIGRTAKGVTGKLALECVAPPWSGKAKPIALKLDKDDDPVISPNGRWLAAGGESLRVIDLSTSEVAHTVAEYAGRRTFSNDASRLAYLADGKARVISVPDGKLIREVPIGLYPRDIVLRPGDDTVVIEEEFHIAIHPPKGKSRKLFLGGRVPPPEVDDTPASQIDLAEQEREMRKQMEASLKQFEKMAAQSKMPADQLQQVRQQMEASVQEVIANLGNVNAQAAEPQELPMDHPQIMRFNADGSRLYVGCGGGLRVFDWSTIANGGDATEALYTHGDDSNVAESIVHALVEDVARNRLLFSDMRGAVYAMNLADGSVQTCIELPNACVSNLQLSPDGQTLAVLDSGRGVDRDKERWTVYVYRA